MISRLLVFLTFVIMIVSPCAAADLPRSAPQTEAAPPEADTSPPMSGVFLVHPLPESEALTANRLEARGYHVLSYLPDPAFLVLGPDHQTITKNSIGRVSSWSPHRAIRTELRELASKKVDSIPEENLIVAGFADPFLLCQARAALGDAGSIIAWSRENATIPQIGMRVPAHRLGSTLSVLENSRGLVFAEPQAPLQSLNHDSAWRCQSGEPQYTPIFDQGLFGENQVIAVADSGIDIDACFFADPNVGLPATNGSTGTEVNLNHRKVLAVDFYWDEEWPNPAPTDWDTLGHGSHTAGSAAGDSNANGQYEDFDGMAPAAKLVIQDGGFGVDDCTDFPGFGCPVHPYEPMLQQAYDQGARIHSNSYGDEENILPFARYTERTADMDRFIWNHKEFVIVAAAGNAGGTEGTVISPSTGKNVLSIGATGAAASEPPCVAGFSSRGWAHDGRIKPDIVAPGSQVLSAGNDSHILTDNCFISQLSGTSMATPKAAGLAALVRQYFMEGFYPGGFAEVQHGFEPSSALVRATLIASAVDLRTLGCTFPRIRPIPSRDQGWGLVQLDTALVFADSATDLFVDDHRRGFENSRDSPRTVTLSLTESGPLKAVLVWTDPPSSSAASINLVNNLDLVVNGPGGRFKGNVFEEGVSLEGGTADLLNTVEVVWLPEADAGIWSISVMPSAVNIGPQDYALVVTGPIKIHEPRDMREGDRAAP